MDDLFSMDTFYKLGALWAGLQAFATVLTGVFPKHTIAFRIAKAIAGGAARHADPSTQG